MEDRLTELETKISYQEQFIEELNQFVIEQQKTIEALEVKIETLTQKITNGKDDSDIIDQSLEVPPPHY